MNPIQGKDAILSFYKDAYVPYVCATDFTLTIDTPSLPTRTRGDGPWRYFEYQDIGWSLTLGGVLVFSDADMDGTQLMENQMQLNHLPARIAYTAADGSIKTYQGTLKLVSSATTASVGDVVKGTYSFEGSGPLLEFNGLIPCPSVITNITVTGQTSSDGIVHISFTYTGDVYQVKYRIDGQGDYVYAAADATIDIPGLARANHSVEIIPICQNSFEGTGRSKTFQVTQSQTCTSVITTITVNTSTFSVTNTHTGAATLMKYRIDGGTWINSGIDTPLAIPSISPGNHTIEEIPICANNLEGTGLVQAFTIVAQPSQSKIGFSFTPSLTTDTLNIYVNGDLIISENVPSSGFFMAAIGSSIKGVINAPVRIPYRSVVLVTRNVTTSTNIDTRSDATSVFHSVSLQYIFTANGNEFLITGTINNL